MKNQYKFLKKIGEMVMSDNYEITIPNPPLYFHVPLYVTKLIDTGHILPDRTVSKSLNTVALEIQKLGIQPTATLLNKLFINRNGKPYSMKACKEAVIYANVK